MKKTFTTMIMAASFLLSSAQIPFEVQSPTWKYLANPTSEDGINIRKSPSATAPRMLIDETKIENWDVPAKYSAYWSTATPKTPSIYPILLSSFEYAPIIGEQNGWYELEGVGVKGCNAWVSAKLCKKLTPEAVTIADINNNEYYKSIASGNETYVFNIFPNEMDGDIVFELGKLENGFIVWPYQLYAYSYESGATTGLKKDSNGNYSFVFNKEYGDEFGNPILKNLPEDTIKEIITKMTKKEHPSVTTKINGELFAF